MIDPLKAAIDGAPVDLRDFHRAINELIETENARQSVICLGLDSALCRDVAAILMDHVADPGDSYSGGLTPDGIALYRQHATALAQLASRLDTHHSR